MASRDLKVTLLGEDKTSGAFGSAGGGASKFGAMAVAAFAAVAAAAAGTGVALFKIGGEFDKSYDTIRVGTGATGKVLDGLKDDFRAVVKDVPTDFASASAAIADLNTRTGLTGEPLRQLSKQMLEMTRLTGGDLKANIAGVTRVFGDWNISADKQSDTMDYLFKVSQSTGIGIEGLSQKVVQFGAPLRQMGFDFETSAAMLGKWEKEGVNTEAVLAGMKIGLGKFSKAGKDPVEAMRSVSEAIKGAGSAGEANMIAIEAFGQRAGPDMAAAIREGRFDLDALMSTLKGSKETILGAAADTESFGEKWTMFKNNVLLALEPVAERVFTAMGVHMDRFSAWWETNGPGIIATALAIGVALRTAFESAVGAVQSLTSFLREHQTAAQAVGVVVAGVAAVIAAAWVAQAAVAVANAARSVAAWFATATASTTSATIQSRSTAQIVVGWIAAAAGATVNAAKVVAGWVATGVGAVASSAVHAAQVAAQVARWVILATAGAAANAARIVAAWVLTSAGAVKAGAVMVAQTAVQVARWAFLGAQSLLHAAKVAAAWLIAMGPIGIIAAAVIGVVVLIVKNWDTIRSKTEQLWNAVRAATAAAWDAIKGAVSAGISFLVGLFMNFTGPGLIIKHWDTIKNATTNAWNAVKALVANAIVAVMGAIGGLAAIPGRIGGWFGQARDAAASALGGLVSTVAGIPGRILGALGNLGGMLVNAGRELIGGLIRGIGEKIGDAVQKVRDGLGMIGRLLPGSPVKDGPLRVFNNGRVGKQLMGMLAGGIESGQGGVRSALTDALDVGGMNVGGVGFANARLAATASSAPREPAGRNLTVNINGQVGEIDEARLVTLLQRAERLAGI